MASSPTGESDPALEINKIEDVPSTTTTTTGSKASSTANAEVATPLSALVTSKLAALESQKEKENQDKAQLAREVNKQAKLMRQEVSALSSQEERMAALEAQVASLLKMNKSLERDLLILKAEYDVALTARDDNAALLQKSQKRAEVLDKLCRELQAKSAAEKAHVEAVRAEAREEQLKLSAKFKDGLDDISAKINAEAAEREAISRTNIELHEKLVHAAKQLEYQEKTNQIAVLEKQMAENKMAAAQGAFQEAEAGMLKMIEMNKALVAHKTALEADLALYKSQYGEFEQIIKNSRQVVADYATALEGKKTRVAELEAEVKKIRAINASLNLQIIAHAKESPVSAAAAAATASLGTASASSSSTPSSSAPTDAMAKRCTQLETLCRTLQNERSSAAAKATRLESSLRALLESKGGESLSVSEVAALLAGSSSSADAESTSS